MNNPYNLTLEERAITPMPNFNKGINVYMSKERRKEKQKRHKDNAENRLIQSSK